MSKPNQNVTLSMVLRAFVNAEIAKDHCKLIRALWESHGHAWDILANIAEKDKLHVLRKAIEAPDSLDDSELRLVAYWLGEFGTQRKTLVPFTTGSYADTRYRCITSWHRQEVPVKELWIKQTDDATTTELKKHMHNVADAIGDIAALNCHEPWDGSRNPPPIICLEWTNTNRKGQYWVLDGTHRAIAKALSDLNSSIPAFVGRVEKSEECLKGFADD